MKITILDYIKNKLVQKMGDTLRNEYINETKYNYINVSPYFKYSFFRLKNKNFRGLYAFSSINLEIPVGAKAKHTKAFYNPVRIDETNSYDFQEQLFRYGFQLGLGWDLFDANVEKVARTILSPYISVNFGSKILTDFGSTMNTINFKAGISIKLGIDKKKYDTLKFKPEEKTVLNVPAIEPSLLDAQELILTKIDAKEIEPIFIEPEDRIAPALEPSSQSSLGNESLKLKRKMELDRKYIINYPKSEKEVELTASGKDFMKEVAEYLSMNPSLIIIIDGYNDDKGGSVKENQKLSLLRAENAKKELLNRGINSERILISGKGSINLITSNSTPEGRARNRRIEIIIKKGF
jgi:outer membrane protein OmpA-like peptidoglycan-associated protein